MAHVYLLLPLYIYQSITKKCPIAIFSEIMDSSVKSHGEVEYDIQRKIRSEVWVLMLLYISRSITKKFPIETLLEMMDSSIENLGEVEYDKQNWL